MCSFVDLNHKYYSESYMINTNTFQADVTLPTQFQNDTVVTNSTTFVLEFLLLLAVLTIVNLTSCQHSYHGQINPIHISNYM